MLANICFRSLGLLVALIISLKNSQNLTFSLYLQFWIFSNFIYIITGHYKSILRYYDRLFIYKNIFRNFLIILSISGFQLFFKQNSFSKIGDNPFPTNPMSDRAKGYIDQGKVKSAVTNYGSFINWDFILIKNRTTVQNII